MRSGSGNPGWAGRLEGSRKAAAGEDMRMEWVQKKTAMAQRADLTWSRSAVGIMQRQSSSKLTGVQRLGAPASLPAPVPKGQMNVAGKPAVGAPTGIRVWKIRRPGG